MRRILMTTDGSENALKAAAYLADLYGKARDLEITDPLHLPGGAAPVPGRGPEPGGPQGSSPRG